MSERMKGYMIGWLTGTVMTLAGFVFMELISS